jgi:gliding-associated putative ABC transporter substrate-binding component GldG
MLRFSGSLDSVKATGIRKTPLLFTSRYSRKAAAPLKINLNDLRKEISQANFSTPNIPVAYLLEGKFSSLFENRFLPDGADSAGRRTRGEFARVAVFADGDVVRNEINRRTGEPLELGFDPVTRHTFANQELVTNLLAFITDESGLITARTREIRMRPLDKEKAREEKTFWQIVNIALPLVLLVLVGVVKAYWRKRRFGRFEIHA